MELKNMIKCYTLEKNFEVIDKSEEVPEDFVESTVAIAKDVLENKGS